MEPQSSLPYSQAPATCPYAEHYIICDSVNNFQAVREWKTRDMLNTQNHHSQPSITA